MRIHRLVILVACLTLTGVANAYACSPYGLIGDKWRNLGGSGSPLGDCVEDEKDDGAGGRIELFRSGWIDWDGHSQEAFAVWGLIGVKWRELGLVQLGHPTTDERGAPDGFGRYNYFQANNGAVATIYFNPQSVYCLQEHICLPYVVIRRNPR